MGGLADVVVWALFAAAAGFGLAAAAMTLFGRVGDGDEGEFAGGYNALEPMLDRRPF